ncbi:L-threonylcarbamoyladenylate synthase [Sulfidibacter corallicola]|uniref:Threonylcarbamoyl-AMP synthase n=1 Tax=Sulfidibacter corallicola TaxID=2818388 RepID=A0A8A4TGZ5_SULCO|nr:L-threonylcarbamoyladenylate synthase [Sulfidibacter corallicola]QTD47998.1 threonylcarbamoyl-AMP synthase [Sulfidibacter corallicola]
MRILNIHPETPQQRLVDMALAHLRQGGLLAYPTDTCYGLGCSIYEKKAIDAIYRLKRMKPDKQLSFICNDLTHISEYGQVSNRAYKLMRKLLPGPYTFVLPATKEVPKLLQSKRKHVGIRVPDHPVILEIVRQLGNPIISTTCQLADDEMPCCDIYDIKDRFGNLLDMAIDGDYIYPEVSTVVSIHNDDIEILREGKGDISPFLSHSSL